jgi:glutathione synthase/RimK-type ligase-like ATP-grasp enzyme
MKIGIVGSQLVRRKNGAVGYETDTLRKAFRIRGHDVVLIDVSQTTIGVIEGDAFARAKTEQVTHKASEFDALLVRRTLGGVDAILDFCRFAQLANPNVFVADPLDTLVRGASKVESIAKRAGARWQPDTQILSDIEDLDERFAFPLVSKPMYDTKGKGVTLCNDKSDLEEQLAADYGRYAGYSILVQPDITGQREYRVVVVDGVALGVCSKPAPVADGVIARNSDNVSEFNRYEGANVLEVAKFAEKVALKSGLFLCGIDIIERDGHFYVLECNRNPQFQNFDFTLGIRTADHVAKAVEDALDRVSLRDPKKDKPIDNTAEKHIRMFIGSSTEGLKIAETIQWGLHRTSDIETSVWHQDVFRPTKSAFSDLVSSTKEFDYAVFCITADDQLRYREQDILAPRDNVIFEAGLFIGALGAERVFLVVSTDAGAKIPTDLSGVNLIMWKPQKSGNLRSALGPAIVEIREAIGI